MTARPDLVDLLKRLDDWDCILDAFERASGSRPGPPDPDAVPMVNGLAITPDEACLLGHATLGEVHAAMRVANERAKWETLAMGNAIEAMKSAREVLEPWWSGDTKLKDAMAAAPADMAEKAQRLFAEHDYWAAAIDDKRWNMTEADLKEGWLRGEFRRVELDDDGTCICWRQIAIIDPTAAQQRADMVADYLQAEAEAAALMERLIAEHPSTAKSHDEQVNDLVAAIGEEDSRVVVLPVVMAGVIDVFDEKHGVPVDDAGMPVGGA